MTTEKENIIARAKQQAQAQLESIQELMAAWDKSIDDGNSDAQDEAQEAIQCDPLSVEVRSDWYTPGDHTRRKPGEFLILLCTGGPAVRLIGDLNEYCHPESVKLQCQDWFTAWTDVDTTPEEDETLLAYCSQFYFGE